MRFFTILRSFGLEREFVNLLRRVPKQQLDNLGLTKINIFKMRAQYTANSTVQDVSVDANANVSGKSPVNLRGEQIKPWSKIEGLYWFWKKAMDRFGKERADYLITEVLKGHLYIHDLTKWDQPYCYSFDMKRVLLEGRPYSRLVAKPARHLRSLVGQFAEFGMDVSQEQAGAVAFSSMALAMAIVILEENKERSHTITCLSCGNTAPEDSESCPKCNGSSCLAATPPISDKEIENTFQNFVHIINNQFRVGGDSPFTNLSIFSPTFLEEMYGQNVYNGFGWEDIKPVVRRVQNIIVDFMARGDPTSNMMYRFPVVTFNIYHSDEKTDVDTPEVEELLRKNRRGFFNINKTDQVAMCCRLQMKKKERISSLGTGGDNIGSLRVVTINMPSIQYEAGEGGDTDEIFQRRMEDARDLLLCHLDIMRELSGANFLKFLSMKWVLLEQFYLTIGLHGVPEFLQDKGLEPFGPEWLAEAKWLLRVLKTFCEAQTEWDFNFEMVPAESATKTMADSNNIVYGAKDDFYSNQFVPLYATIDLMDRVKIESELCDIVTGGTMTFINFDELPDEESALSFQKKLLKETKIPQYAVNIGMSRCKACDKSCSGIAQACPECGCTTMEVFTRIVGYFVPLSTWDSRRKSEFKTRRWY